MSDLKSHPAYARGYEAAFQGCGASELSQEYRAGFAAGRRAVKLFEENGFERTASGFSISLPTKRGAA